MPRIITDDERERTKKSILKHTKQLIIDKKGIRDITVDDIIRSAGMGKSTFYSCFKSKEECIYGVFECTLADGLKRAGEISGLNLSVKEKVLRILREVYLSEESLTHYMNPAEVGALFRRLPSEYKEMEHKINGGGIMEYAVEVFGINETQAETINMFLGCIDYIATYRAVSEQARNESLDAIVVLTAEYICGINNK